MTKVIGIVMLEQGCEPDALNVEISIRQKTCAPGPQSRTDAFAAISVGIHRDGFLPPNVVFGLHGAERKGGDELLVEFRGQLVRSRHVKTEISRQIKVAPDHSAWRPDHGKLREQVRPQNVQGLRESQAVFGKSFRLDSKSAKRQGILRPLTRDPFS